MEKSEM